LNYHKNEYLNLLTITKIFIKKSGFLLIKGLKRWVLNMVTKKLLPLAAMEKIMRAAGAGRVSEDAKAALKEVLEDIGQEIAAKANQLALHSGRKTIKASDIKLAAKE
jgi:histone H3/H4